MIRLPMFAFNVGTVQFWQSARRAFGARSWRGALERFAMQHGEAIAMLGNGGALIVRRGNSGKLERSTIAPDCVSWTR